MAECCIDHNIYPASWCLALVLRSNAIFIHRLIVPKWKPCHAACRCLPFADSLLMTDSCSTSNSTLQAVHQITVKSARRCVGANEHRAGVMIYVVGIR